MTRSTRTLYGAALRSSVLSARRRKGTKRKKSTRKKRPLFSSSQVEALRARATGVSAPSVSTWSRAPSGDAALLRLAALRGLSRHVGGAKVIHSNPRKRRSSMRKRHSRRARARRYGNPVILSNKSRRRNAFRLSHVSGARRRYRRNAGFTKLFNPPSLGSLKALPSKALASVKTVVSVDNAKKAGAAVATILAAWALPARFLPAWDDGLKGIGLTVGAGALMAALVGVVAPSLAPIAAVGAGVAALLKTAMIYGRSWVTGGGFSGLGDFLTLGQIPASMIQGGRGMGDFLTTTGPVTAMGPGRSAALGGGEVFSDMT